MARSNKTPTKKAAAKKPRPSTTGKRNPKVDQSNWRTRLQQSRVKFDDDQKEIYLRELAEHGLKGRAAEAAGVCPQTVGNHLENDPDFEAAHNAALESYRDTLADEVRRRGRDGWLEPVYNKDGRVYESALDDDGLPIMRHKDENRLVYAQEYGHWGAEERKVLEPIMVPAYIRKFSDRMLELDVKRVDPSFRDKSSVDLNHAGGGVLVAPAEMTPEEWIQREQERNKERQDPRERAKAEKAANEKAAKEQK